MLAVQASTKAASANNFFIMCVLFVIYMYSDLTNGVASDWLIKPKPVYKANLLAYAYAYCNLWSITCITPCWSL